MVDAAPADVVAALGVAPREKRRLPVLPVAALLDAQQTLTAVERFAKAHDTHEHGTGDKLYRDLVPLERPRSGEQYAFEVDLDACTGCKACVAGCHAMNGLDEAELWRTVGLLHGGSATSPVQQTVTTSCHHCLEPACMQGCPTRAYEKDPVTGIVKHLDDQCFGCQYCTLMCPYDAPKYNEARGVVRKCDMCQDRLAHGEAPACVDACPNGAIAIRVVQQSAVVAAADAGLFLPGAPGPEHTLPTTAYRSKRAMPNNMLPADFHRTRPEHGHPSLVVMLTLTQVSAGAFLVGFLRERLFGAAAGNAVVEAAVACVLALVALFASVFHLGRPLLAWRAVLGLRTSWLSREALAFGAFAQFSIAYGAMASWPALSGHAGVTPTIASACRALAALAGIAGVFCSVMVYVATRREQWSGPQTGVRFFGTTLLLGSALVFAVSAWTNAATSAVPRPATELPSVVLAVALVKAAVEGWALTRKRERRHSTLRRVAIVMLGDLRRVTAARFGLLLLGGVLVPLLVTSGHVTRGTEYAATFMVFALLAAEACERYLFFRSAPASRMPGGVP